MCLPHLIAWYEETWNHKTICTLGRTIKSTEARRHGSFACNSRIFTVRPNESRLRVNGGLALLKDLNARVCHRSVWLPCRRGRWRFLVFLRIHRSRLKALSPLLQHQHIACTSQGVRLGPRCILARMTMLLPQNRSPRSLSLTGGRFRSAVRRPYPAYANAGDPLQSDLASAQILILSNARPS
jgi:hypothetical protein